MALVGHFGWRSSSSTPVSRIESHGELLIREKRLKKDILKPNERKVKVICGTATKINHGRNEQSINTQLSVTTFSTLVLILNAVFSHALSQGNPVALL